MGRNNDDGYKLGRGLGLALIHARYRSFTAGDRRSSAGAAGDGPVTPSIDSGYSSWQTY